MNLTKKNSLYLRGNLQDFFMTLIKVYVIIKLAIGSGMARLATVLFEDHCIISVNVKHSNITTETFTR